MKAQRVLTVTAATIGALVIVSVVAAAGGVTVGAPANVSKQAGYNAEGSIAINPTDPTKLFAAFNNSSNTGEWARSTDSGATWSAAGTGIPASCCDNVAEWDSFGNLYLTNIDDALGTVPLYLSTNNGANFSLLQTIDTCDGCIDQPTLKAGPSSIWVSWWNNGLIEARGADVNGLNSFGSWTPVETAIGSDLGGGCQFGDVAVAPSGVVTVVCQTDTQIKAWRDLDGTGPDGLTGPVMVAKTGVDKFDFITPQNVRSVDSEANLAYDLSDGPYAGRLYLVYTDEKPNESNNTDIWLKYSDDNGKRWSKAVKVNDDGTQEAQFFPVVTVDSTTGNVFVSFLDARNDPANVKTEYWGAVSADGGSTFTANFQLSAGQSSADESGDSFGNEYGDYSGNDYFGSKAYGIWPDSSNSTGDNPDNAGNAFDMYTAQVTTAPPCLGSLATIVYGGGNDLITGTPGDDVIFAGGGNDTIDGGGGNDKICGGDGNDTLLEGSASNGSDIFSGGAGVDTVDYGSRVNSVVISLDGKNKSGEAGERDTMKTDVENGTGGSGNDRLTGNDSPNTLTGGPGKDKLVGGGGSDTLNGSDGVEGNDNLDGSREKPVPVADTCTADTASTTPDKIKNC